MPAADAELPARTAHPPVGGAGPVMPGPARGGRATLRVVKYVLWLLTTMVGLAAATWLLAGIRLTGSGWQDDLLPFLVVAVVLAFATVMVEPVMRSLGVPFLIVTLGIFLLAINTSALMLASWVADRANAGFAVDGWWTALGGGLVIALVSGFIDLVALEDE